MSLKSTIYVPNEVDHKFPHTTCTGFVGISSVDHNVYIWQLKKNIKRKRLEAVLPPPILVICRVSSLVPCSWNVFKELNLSKNIAHVRSCFSAACSKMAFRLESGLLLLDMTSGQIETQSINKLAGLGLFVFQFAETSVGWVEVSYCRGQISCYKTFPVPGEDRMLVTFAVTDNSYNRSWGKGADLTFDSFMYITLRNSHENPLKVCKLVSYNFLSADSTEMAFDQWNSSTPNPYRGPFLISNSNLSFLIRPSEELGNRVDVIQHDHLGIKLTYLNQPYDEYSGQPLYSTRFTIGNNQIAMIHKGAPVGSIKKLFLTVANVTVPSLKSLAVWAIQKHCGTFGNDDELFGGISEEKLKNAIGYQQNKKLF